MRRDLVPSLAVFIEVEVGIRKKPVRSRRRLVGLRVFEAALIILA